MEKLLKEINEWQLKTFPSGTPLSKAYHLADEVKELLTDIEYKAPREDIEMEYADCFFLLFGSAMTYGMDLEKIQEIMRKKFEINKQRKWGKPDENGVVFHEKEN